MKSLIFIVLTFISFGTGGQETVEDLPRRVSKSFEKTFGKETYRLENLTANPGEDFTSGYEGNFYRLKQNGEDETAGFLHIGRVKTCRTGGCGAPGTDTEQNSSEYFDYVILFDTSANIELVKIFNYQATHGHEITARGWLKQFLGFSGRDSLEVGKDIDTISGATISVYAITSDVQYKTEKLKELID
ncbi:MAG TPA: FMN-binding protein [Tangfeifania sp.]|nr:FMN-binding protein [Tangfeifania sp.]